MKPLRFFVSWLLFLAAYLSAARAQQGPHFIRLEDASGYTPTSEQLAELEAAASELCAVFDSAGFGGQFKVYDFGFYLHHEATTGGYPEPFARKIE